MTPDVEKVVARLRAAGLRLRRGRGRGAARGGLRTTRSSRRCSARREAGEPLEVIVGWAEFRGPSRRRRTGGLRAAAPHRAARASAADRASPAPARSSSSCAAGSPPSRPRSPRELPGAEVYAADIDPAEVAVARRNLPPASGGDRVFEGDLFDALPAGLRGRVDILIANAPYVPTAEIALMPPEAREHEPLVALDGGADGLDVQRRIAADAREWLAPGGSLLIETSVRQAPATAEAMRAGGLEPRTVHDDELDATVVIGRSPSVTQD